MIKELVIQNFQSHKGSILHFDKGVNVIVGSSDSGKTAIIRALRWAVTNKPSGEDFRSHWGGATSVTVAVGESNKKVIGNKVITRTKSDKENLYSLDETNFKAFGQSVPEEIQNAFNLTEVNLQGQLDAPFLLSSSPGEVAKHFNKVANLELIDQSIKKATSKINTFQSQLNAHEINITKTESKIASFIDVDSCENRIKEIEKLSEDLEKLTNSMGILHNIKVLHKTITQQLSDFEDFISLEGEINTILSLFDDISNLKNQYESLKYLLRDLNLNAKKIETYNILTNQEIITNEVIKIFTNLEILQKEWKNLHNLAQDIKLTSSKVNNMEKTIIQKEEFYKNNFPDVCPLCGNYIKDVQLCYQ